MTAVPATTRGAAGSWFEDFTPGRRMRHARALTIGDVENNFMSKLVMNTAQSHWNEHYLQGGPLGQGRLVFGLLTASVVFGLATEDTAEQALAELGCDAMRFLAPVHQGDTIAAYTEVVAAEDADRPDAGVVTFRHWGVNQDGGVVFTGLRRVLVKRAPHGTGQ